MEKKIDIILNTLFRTDHAYSSVSLSMAKEFAKTHRVFYINHPYSLKDVWSERKSPKLHERAPQILRGGLHYEHLPEIPDNFVAVTPSVTLPINFLPYGKLYDKLYAYNRAVMLRTIRQVVKDYQLKDFIYLTCYDPFFMPILPEGEGQLLNIYQCIDDIATESYVARHGVRLETAAAKAADMVLVTSTQLLRKFEAINPNAYMLNNAVDISIFKDVPYQDYEKPAEIAHITHKIIGFIGNIDAVRIDFDLLKAIAEGNPDKTLLMVGPINADGVSRVGLDKMPNVIFTGSKRIYDIPAYLKHIDVAILPFLLNQMTRSIYPLKINEYLAGGKAVVSTNFSEDIRSFNSVVRIADDYATFNAHINTALNDYTEGVVAERVRIAHSNTWGDRIAEFWRVVDKQLRKSENKQPNLQKISI